MQGLMTKNTIAANCGNTIFYAFSGCHESKYFQRIENIVDCYFDHGRCMITGP